MRLGIAVLLFLPLAAVGCSSGGSSQSTAPPAQPPTANAGGPYTGTAGTAVSFSGAGSSDPQGQTLTYSWTFGDGGSAAGVSPSHTYTAAGTYTVALTVTDTSGLSGSATGKATIAVAPLAGPAISGTVSSGAQAISGAHVYLFAAGTAGYGTPSVSLLSAANTGTSDTVGAYVATSATGAFNLATDYTCTSGQQLYLYALGGNAGAGVNTASGLLAALGPCPAAATTVTVNEVTTIAAAYALAGFATDATHVSSSGTALAQVGVANAFANSGNLATLATGVALATTPAGNGTVPQQEINTLANILAGCVNSSGSSSAGCAGLFSNALANGTSGAAPTDTATAAINIAHNPAANYTKLSNLALAAPVFSPTSSTYFEGSINSFNLIVVFTGGGLGEGSAIAIDGSGSAWIPNGSGNSVVEISSLGLFLSGASGYSGGGLNGPAGVAIDASGNAWITNYLGNSVTVISPSGAFLSGTSGYTGASLEGPGGVAIDRSGNAWVANYAGNSATEISAAGSVFSAGSVYSGGGLSRPNSIACDAVGDIWATSIGNIVEFSSSGSVLSGASGYSYAGLRQPDAIALNGSGTARVSDLYSGSLISVTDSGVVSSQAVSGLYAPNGLALDGTGSAWISTSTGLSVVSSAGSVEQTFTGYNGFGSSISGYAVAIDGSGNAWLLGNHQVVELVGAAVPVVTPLSVGVKNNTLGTRP